MTIFARTASPGQRWKIYLPRVALIQNNVLSMSNAGALIRNHWLSGGARPSQPLTIAANRRFVQA